MLLALLMQDLIKNNQDIQFFDLNNLFPIVEVLHSAKDIKKILDFFQLSRPRNGPLHLQGPFYSVSKYLHLICIF